MHKKLTLGLGVCFVLSISSISAQELLWTVGTDDNGWPQAAATPGDGGGAMATFVQENGVVNPLPGTPDSPEEDTLADNDYYFAGTFTDIIPSNGDYVPLGYTVSADEEATERALTPAKTELRYHFNLPENFQATDRLSVTFDAVNLDTSGARPRFGVEVYVNNVLVQPQIVIHSAEIDKDFTTPQFSLESVNAQAGPGFDNIVTLKGTDYNADGGGSWMGIDYVQLNHETEIVPAPTLPLLAGGTNATFVQENGVLNPLPGNPNNPATATQADNDYYFGGAYNTIIPANAVNGDYTPVGVVSSNEKGAERRLSGTETEQRFHFNLPNALQATDQLEVTFAASALDTTGTDPQYGIEVYVNGVRVQAETVIRTADIGKEFTTAQFSLATAGAQVGPGIDNILTLKGVSHSAQGGGSGISIDHVQISLVAKPIPAPTLPWAVGINDNNWPILNGGGANASFVQENGEVNPLPGVPNSPEVDQQADNDYYLAGLYNTVVTGNGTYQPVGPVPENEEAAERALTPGNTELRYHFNLPATLTPDSQLSLSFDAYNIDESGGAAQYGVEVYVNNVLVQPEITITPDLVGTTFNTPAFNLQTVNAQAGPGFDNIVTLKGKDYSADGGGNWLGIDYVQMNPVVPAPFPWTVGKDDNAQPVGGNGGGPNTSFVQENGNINPLPGIATSPEVNQQSDNDYYFAGVYTNLLEGIVNEYGEYEAVGPVLVNEESAERAFAGADNDLRYHFNLPSTLKPTDQLMVTFDSYSLDTSGTDPHYGIEIYFNGTLIQPEIDIYTADLDKDYTTAPFTLADVGAQVGPGYDNIVSLKGINFNGDGGGNWMGIDYVRLDPMPTPIFPFTVGMDDGGWPAGDGGGANASFVQENGVVNELPGTANSPEVDQQADNDYYFAGIYTNIISSVVDLYGEYEPIGIVVKNEEAAERALTVGKTEQRYHFNLPTTLKPTNLISVTFEPLNLQDPDDVVTDPHWGVEVLFNGVLVQTQLVIHPADLNIAVSTPTFTLQSVNAQVGLGADNIVTLRGTEYSAEGGGNWMGLDYVKVNDGAATSEAPEFLATTLSNGKITLDWTGTGTLEWAPTVNGPWTPVTTPAKPYIEDVVAAQNRFYRLRN